jgi:uncharacterized membrane protein
VKKILFALFERRETLNDAMSDLESAGIPRERLQVFMHPDKVEEADLNFRESDAMGGLWRGALIGLVIGMIFGGLVASPLGWVDMRPLPAAAFAAVLFAIFGALGGAISGAAVPNSDMEEMADNIQDGQVLVSAEVENSETEATVEEIFRRHGAVQSPGMARAPAAS